MRPFFSYYGGKWRDAVRNYPAPAHGTIVEPFAGSAGYAVRYHSRRVLLCDVDPIVIGVWKYLIATQAQEILSLPDLQEGQSTTDLHIPQEAQWLIGFWLNKATASPRKRPSSWMRSGVRPGSFWGPRVRETIAGQVDRIRHWRAVECSYQNAPHRGDATWFVDPPYQGAGKHYRAGSCGLDYAHLSEWCRGRGGQVIACENEGANWLPFRILGSTKTARKGRRSAEAVWVSGPGQLTLEAVS